MQSLRRAGSSRAAQGCLMVFALFWTGFSLVWTLLAWRQGGLLPALFGIPFLLIGIALLFASVWRTIAGIKLVKPLLTISKSDLRIGETFTVQYEQAFRGTVEVQDLSLQLIFRESATYTRGTDTTTDTHDDVIESTELTGRVFNRGETFRQTYRFSIPEGAMHTFIRTHNKLQWFVRLMVRMAGWPDYVDEFEVNVLPERMW